MKQGSFQSHCVNVEVKLYTWGLGASERKRKRAPVSDVALDTRGPIAVLRARTTPLERLRSCGRLEADQSPSLGRCDNHHLGHIYLEVSPGSSGGHRLTIFPRIGRIPPLTLPRY